MNRPTRWAGSALLMAGSLALGSCSGVDVLSTGTRYVAVAAGAQHSCALTDEAVVLCWGSNVAYQLGWNGPNHDPAPRALFTGPLDVQAVVAGGSMSCILAGKGVVLCWGGAYQKLQSIGVSRPVRQVAVGGIGCAVDQAGAVFCWDDPQVSPHLIALDTAAIEVATGSGSGCAVLAGDRGIECWTGTTGTATLNAGTNGIGLHQLTRGASHTCAIDKFAIARCWGSNGAGQLGTGDTSPHTTPALVLNGDRLVGENFISIHATADRTCGVTFQNRAFCWGDGDTSPYLVPGGMRWVDLLPGLDHTCGISTDDDFLYCFGSNNVGQLGDGTTDPRGVVPVRVIGP